jgi:tRNA(adenine34) deaminase
MTGWTENDQAMMRAALAEAQLAADEGEVPVGAIVVLANAIVGRGHNRSIEDNDPSAHAEIVALREAGRTQKNHRLTGATMFVSLEPCAMCVGALVQARISRLVFAAYDAKAGAMGSAIDLAAKRYLNHRIEVNGGLLATESSEMLQQFFADQRAANSPD